MTIRGLYPHLAHEYREDNISAFFSPRAVSEGRYMKYDPIKKTVTTDADDSMFELSSIDQEMEVQHVKPASTIEKQVFEKERQENDSVSTFQSKRAPPTEIQQQARQRKQKHPMLAVPHH